MYELNRARLVGIGPRGARYSDVTLDLSGLGEQVPSQNLFDAPARRPAPSSLLLLENGGGKSVLLKLLFSVVLPGRRNTVGGASLEKFVLDGDTGHVALEWMHVSTGAQLVTAKVYQRRTRSSTDKYPVAEAWYSFRPSDALDLDTLPVMLDGRRRRLDGFREAVEEADRLEAATELSWLGDDQGRWRSHLRERGIEPDLFDIQRRMNVDEGEAAKAFKYSSSKDFVDWLLTTVTDPADAASVADTFSQWAANLADREQMLLERDFIEGVITGLDPLADAHAARQAAELEAASALRTAQRLAVSLEGRRAAERVALERITEEQKAAQATVASRSTERDAARALYNEVHRQRLKLEHEQAQAQKQQTQGRLDAAELELSGWQAISAIDELDRAVVTSDQLGAQVAAADEDAAPALARRDEAAGRLLAKYLAEAEASDHEAGEQERHVLAAERAAQEADDERTETLGLAAAAGERHRAAKGIVAAADERLATAAAAGLVPTATVPAQVADLAGTARAEHAETVTRLDGLKAAARAADVDVKAAEGAVSQADGKARSLTAAASDAARELHGVEAEAARLTQLTAIAEPAGVDSSAADGTGDARDGDGGRLLTVDELDDAADRLLGQLGRDIDDHTEYLDGLRAAQQQDARVVEALGTGGLLPPREEVECALEVLDAAGVIAHAGWRYLHEAVPAGVRAELIAAHPALADGIILVDAGQMPAARRALEDARLLPAAAVAVGPGAALLDIATLRGAADVTSDPVAATDASVDAPAPTRASTVFVVEPTPALYDEESAAARREELTGQMARRGEQLRAGGDQLELFTEARADLQRWRRANPPGHLARLREADATARAHQRAAEGALAAARSTLEQTEETLELAAADVERAAAQERQAADRALKLENLAALVESAAQAQRQLPELETEVRQHQQVAEKALGRRRRSEAARADHARRAEQARAQAQWHRAACADVVSTSGKPAASVPEESLADLRAAAAAAHEIYLAVEVDSDLRRQADAAAARVKSLRDDLALRHPSHVAEAKRLRASPAGADRAS